ncbi:MAG: M13 family metallopeptidase, partial [Calditrichia bacterium]|nr:M13 family metallopeptidase [Calditrichia bacterium]
MMKMLKLLLVLMTVFFIVFVGCAKKNTALDPKAIDLNISPGENFYQYANGTWMKNTPIPDDQNSWGAFQILRDNNLSQLRTILDGAIAAKDAAPGSITQKIRDFYTAGMDTAQIEKDGIALLKNEFDKIASIKSIEDLQNTIAYFHTIGISSIFRTYGYADQENSEMVICQIGMGGLGLPDRDYYTEEQFKGLLEQYKQHVVKMFILVGETEETAKNIAERVVSFETRLAQAVMTRLERRDPYKTYNKMGIYKLQKLSPNWNWNKYFVNVDIKKHGDINIRLPEFLKEISKMVHDVSLDNWKLYLRWKVLDETASYLNSAIEKQNFEFFGKTLYGSKKMQPRWKSVLRTTNSALGEAVGQRYVEKYFPPAAKDRMLRLVANLKATLGERIQQLEWMGPETKEKALVKLEAMGLKIGYPDKWKDYSALEVKDDSYVLNVLRSNKFDVRFNWDKIGKPVEKLEWGMNPQRVNAGYSTAKNEIIFPAGILQPPFFSFDADDAVNYGA